LQSANNPGNNYCDRHEKVHQRSMDDCRILWCGGCFCPIEQGFFPWRHPVWVSAPGALPFPLVNGMGLSDLWADSFPYPGFSWQFPGIVPGEHFWHPGRAILRSFDSLRGCVNAFYETTAPSSFFRPENEFLRSSCDFDPMDHQNGRPSLHFVAVMDRF
jgi:hypothetical protein